MMHMMGGNTHHGGWDALTSMRTLVTPLFVSGVFPLDFKPIVVTLLLKKSSLALSSLSSYQLISLLPFLFNFLEEVVLAQCLECPSSNLLFNSNQSDVHHFSFY